MWRDNKRRHQERVPTWEVLHTYASDYKLIIVGDATMSPYEIAYPAAASNTGTKSLDRFGSIVC